MESLRNLRNLGQELFELGPKGAAFRVAWEISRHRGLRRPGHLPPENDSTRKASRDLWMAHLPFPDPIAVADAVRDRINPDALYKLLVTADRALPGEIECFGRWPARSASFIACSVGFRQRLVHCLTSRTGAHNV